MNIKKKYMDTLNGYLQWIPSDSVFMRPAALPYDENGLSAAAWMKMWESTGKIAPITSEPELLQRYHQGKVCRDWHITEWKEGVRMHLFVPEEFVGSLGCTADNFESIFGKPVNVEMVAMFQS